MHRRALFLALLLLLTGALAQECNELEPDADGVVCPAAERDCACFCTRGYVRDACGVCNGNNTSMDIDGVCCTGVVGCDGICNSTVRADACGFCGGHNETMDAAGVCCVGVVGCDGVCNSGKVVNDCGDCGGEELRRSAEGICCNVAHLDADNHCCAQFDCTGKCGTAVLDACGVCDGRNATLDGRGTCCADHERGCDGFCFGAVVDLCGHCGGHNHACCGADGECGGRGVCSAEFRTCKCNVGWTGAGCALSQFSCEGIDCGAHGACVELDGAATCACEPRWTGARCQTPRCATRGVYDPDADACVCIHPYDAAQHCEACLPPRANHARVCVEMPHSIIVREVPRLAATMLLARHHAEMGGVPVRVFAPESEFNGTRYDCGCRPVAVVSGARYTQAEADAALSLLLSQEVRFSVQSNEELQELTDKRIESYNREIFYPIFIAWAGFCLFALFVGVLAAVYALVSQSMGFKSFLQARKK
jgi:hypothetical protein